MAQAAYKIGGFATHRNESIGLALPLNNDNMKAVEIIMIPVTDQQKAKAFYLNLGFQVVAEAPMGNGETWLQLGLPNGETTISLAKFQGVILETDNIVKETERLAASGVQVGTIDDTPWGKFMWLKDEDGNGLCLHQK
jgi:catechol 2,3-dioxygenase-like lactoylglutathione lyase family enzyme